MTYSHLEGINVGSGQHYAKHWLNTDIIPTDKGQQPDILADINDYPSVFGDRAFKRAYVGHVLEHLWWDDITTAIKNIAYVTQNKVMVVGPCMDKAIATSQPQSMLDAIKAVDDPVDHPWGHKWTPTEELTAQAIRDAGFEPNIIKVGEVRRPIWPNPSTAGWQCAMWFTP